MPKNLEQLVDEVLNKLCEQDFYRFKSGNDLALELAREDMVTFLEAQIRLAYDEGYKQGGVDEQICMEKSGEHHLRCTPITKNS